MIITKLIGGLGNQMFQYAVGRRAACINNTLLKLDISGYENQVSITPRKYVLNIFNIKETSATPDEIQKLKRQSNNFFLKHFPRLIFKIIPFYRQSYIRQRYFHFDPSILNIGNNIYLEGYWSSEKYFKDIEDIIRKEFIFEEKPDEANQKIINRIKNCNSISIHVRRGDYVLDAKTNEFHGVCGLDYYKTAISRVVRQVKNPRFFVFSDDPGWCNVHLRLKYPTTYVSSHLGKKDYEDMRLMSECKHNIIANSSFSWWGAWLNNNPDKIVVAPKQWFRDKSINTSDLIPKSWIRI